MVPLGLKDRAYNIYRAVTSIHKPDGQPNVFIFTMPRSGSTWLMELVWSQPGFKCVNEPFDLRNPLVRKYLKIDSWEALQESTSLPKVEQYIRGYCAGKIHATEPAPFLNKYYRPVTSRIVFKIIHAGEDRINWFRNTFDARIVFFIRHPIAVSLSHEAFPRLEAFVKSDYRRHFTAAQLDLATSLIKGGSKLQKGVLDWCLHNSVPLREIEPDWAVVTYEQLVLEPRPAIDYLAQKLALPDRARMMAHLTHASGVKYKSDAETKKLLETGHDGSARKRLVSKWKDKVSEGDEREAMSILEVFDIDVYRFGDLLPARRFWLEEPGTGIPALEVQPLTSAPDWKNSGS